LWPPSVTAGRRWPHRTPRASAPAAAEQAKLQALSDAIDAAAGYEEADHRALEYTARPKGIPGSDLAAAQRAVLRDLLGTYFGRVPEAVSPMAAYDGDDALDALHFAWAAPPSPAPRTTTACRGRAC